MRSVEQTLLGPGDRLPAAVLDAVAGRPVDLHRANGDSSVLVFPHPGCTACSTALRDLDGLNGELAAWDARPAVVVSDAAEADVLARQATIPVLLDPRSRVRTAAGVGPEGAAVLVADRYGTVFRSDPVAGDHGFPPSDELLTEVRYIAIQCPECSVPDLSGTGG